VRKGLAWAALNRLLEKGALAIQGKKEPSVELTEEVACLS
jgi:hypothetical protein